MQAEEQQRYRVILNQLLEKLNGEIAQRRASSAAVELDQTAVGRLSRMDAMQQQAMSVASDRRAAQRLASVRAALARIDAHRFGRCPQCGDDLEPARLSADPCAVLCLECQTERHQAEASSSQRRKMQGRDAC